MNMLKEYGKEIVEFCKENDIDNVRVVYDNIMEDVDDFKIDNYRFIDISQIDKIMEEKLSEDDYILGCFSDYFLADILQIDVDVIQAMQEVEAFEAIGKLIKSMKKLSELVERYIASDGYGCYFAHYDGEELELCDYYAFKIN